MNVTFTSFNLREASSLTCRVCNVVENLDGEALGFIMQFWLHSEHRVRRIVSVNAANGGVIHACDRRVTWMCDEHGEVKPIKQTMGPRRRLTPRKSIQSLTEVCPKCLVPVRRRYIFTDADVPQEASTCAA